MAKPTRSPSCLDEHDFGVSARSEQAVAQALLRRRHLVLELLELGQVPDEAEDVADILDARFDNPRLAHPVLSPDFVAPNARGAGRTAYSIAGAIARNDGLAAGEWGGTTSHPAAQGGSFATLHAVSRAAVALSLALAAAPARRGRRAPSPGDRIVSEPGLLVLPARQRQSLRLGGPRRRAGAQFRRRLLGFARLEGHVRQAGLHRPPVGLRPALGHGEVYTPQTIVNGRADVTGADAAELQALASREDRGAGGPELSIEAGRGGDRRGRSAARRRRCLACALRSGDARGRRQARRERRPLAAPRAYRRRSRPPRPLARRSPSASTCRPRPIRGSSTPCWSRRPGPGRSSPPSKNAPSDARGAGGPLPPRRRSAYVPAQPAAVAVWRGRHGRARSHSGVRGR